MVLPVRFRHPVLQTNIPGSSNGRTGVFGTLNLGSNPSPGSSQTTKHTQKQNEQKLEFGLKVIPPKKPYFVLAFEGVRVKHRNVKPFTFAVMGYQTKVLM